MADGSIDAQGTELFLSLDGTTALKFDCPTALNGMGYTTAEINLDCLDSVVETKRPGKKSLNAFSVPFIVQDGSEAHEWILNTTNNPTEELPYAIALANGLDDPTLTAGKFVAPGTSPNWSRTVITGTGYAGSLTIDANNGDVVRGSFTFSPQSQVWNFKQAA